MKHKMALSMVCLFTLHGAAYGAPPQSENGLNAPDTTGRSFTPGKTVHQGKPVQAPELLNRSRSTSPPPGGNGRLDNQGELDGVYACSVTFVTDGVVGAPFNATISLNGHADGEQVLLVAAETRTQPFFGYGSGMIGDVDDSTFHGTNSFNQPFSLKAAYASSTGTAVDDELTLTGTYGISSSQTANLSCVAK